MKQSEILIKIILRLIKKTFDLDIKNKFKLERTYAGRHQRSCGAFTSFYISENPIVEIGLYWPIKKLMKCPNLQVVRNDYQPRNYGFEADCRCIGKCKQYNEK